ncbi:MAG TPA: phage Gp37/Gp68 family protein [Pirellulales bacterium]|nr:phage Gp37/Gp68 family protein [Pirellulales bacterium]
MSQTSKIEWTHATWNPVRGCTKISPGCAHCYAETFAERFRGVPGHPYEQGFDLRLVPEKLTEPLRCAMSKMIFVNSMSDLFHERVPDDYIAAVAEVMRMAHWHTFQVLSKRSERMRDLLNGKLRFAAELPNVWWGVSVENRKHGLPRIDHLRAAPAGTRFLSVEPLLEDLGDVDLAGIHWVIVGGESGRGARAMQPDWVRSIRGACHKADIPFFYKQWGAFGADGVRRSKHDNGRVLDGRTYDAMPRRKATKPAPRAERLAMIAQIEAAWGVAVGGIHPLALVT